MEHTEIVGEQPAKSDSASPASIPTELQPIPVLLYHSVADAPAPGQPLFTVRPSTFAEQVAAIVDSGRSALTITELAKALRGERPLPPRVVAVTFDDGFDDTPAAVELLRANGIASTVYVTSDRLAPAGGLTAEALRAVVAAGAEIGAHTVSHPALDEIPLSQAVREIADSKRELEQWLAAEVPSFAYPHGSHDRHVRAAVIDAGFTSAVAVKNALSHPADDPFAIARWTVMRDSTPDEVAATLAGRGLPLSWPGERLRTRAYRRYRRVRRRVRAGAHRR